MKKGNVTDETGKEIKTVFTNDEIFKFSRPDSVKLIKYMVFYIDFN